MAPPPLTATARDDESASASRASDDASGRRPDTGVDSEQPSPVTGAEKAKARVVAAEKPKPEHDAGAGAMRSGDHALSPPSPREPSLRRDRRATGAPANQRAAPPPSLSPSVPALTTSRTLGGDLLAGGGHLRPGVDAAPQRSTRGGGAGEAVPIAPSLKRGDSVRSLAAELAVLREAQQAMRDGTPARALEVLDRNAPLFSGSPLDSERRATRLLALCKASPNDATRQAATNFVADSPSSPLVASVRQACLSGVGAESNRARR